MRLRSWLFLGFVLLVAAGCIRLGFWQLDRLAQRHARNATIEAGLARAVLEIPGQTDSMSLEPHRRVVATGRYDPEHEIALTARTLQGQPGVHLVTPLLLADEGPAILVDRGWIPAEERALPARAHYRIAEDVSVHGVTKPSVASPALFFLPQRSPPSPAQPRVEWQAIDIAGIQSQIPYPLLEVYLAQTEPLPSQEPAPIPQPELDLSEGPHLGYAIQWFSFATIALIGGGYWVLRRQR